jgi:hypothetical protein
MEVFHHGLQTFTLSPELLLQLRHDLNLRRSQNDMLPQ